MENRNSKVILSILGVAILIVAVVGISFAAFTFTQQGAENKITTGQIAMSYTEADAGLEIADAFPMTEDAGKGQTDYFQFTVSASASGKIEIPYEVSIVEQTYTNQLAPSDVYLYLTDGEDNQVMAPTLASEVLANGDFTGNKIIVDDSFAFNAAGSETRTYRLRMWLRSDYVTPNDGLAYTYGLKVNVDAQV